MSLLGTLQLYLQGKAFESDEETEPCSLTESDLSMDDNSSSNCHSLSGSPIERFSPPKSLVPQYETMVPLLHRQNASSPEHLFARYQYLATQAVHGYKASIQNAGSRLLLPFLRNGYETQDAWLDDVVINRWFDHLSAKDSSGNIANLHSTFFESSLLGLSAQGAHQADRQRLLNAKAIFLPRFLNNHWYFVCIQKHNDYFAITCMDSLTRPENLNTSSAHRHCFDFAEKLLESLYGAAYDNFVISRTSEAIHRQGNAIDCGPAICYHAQQICNNQFNPMNPVDYTSFRLEMAHTLIEVFKTPNEFVNGFIPQGKKSRPIDIHVPEKMRLRGNC